MVPLEGKILHFWVLQARYKLDIGLAKISSVFKVKIVVIQSLSHIQLFATLWTIARQISLSFTISQCLLKLMSIESVIPSNHLSSVVPFSCLSLSQHQGLFK